MAIIAPKPLPGPIELSLAGALDDRERARRKALAHRDAFDALSSAERTAFAFDGLQVQILEAPTLLRDGAGVVVGLRLRARARDATGPLPGGDGYHEVVNPPIKVPDGTAHIETRTSHGVTQEIEAPNYRENAVAALKTWLVASLRIDARQHGWLG